MSKFQPLTIQEIVKETDHAVTVKFIKPQDQSFDYQPGQYVTLKLDVNGESLRRAYSMCSSPVTDDTIAVTVKRVEGGKASNYIADHLKAGDQVEVFPPMGNFHVVPRADRADHYILIGAGSGITPLMSILKSVLKIESGSRVTLIYGNSNEQSIIFRNDLKSLSEAYAGRFRVIHSLSNPLNGWEGLRGRLDRHNILQIAQEIITNDSLPKSFWICGPAGMMEEAKQALGFLGITKDQIHQELFTAPLPEEVTGNSGGAVVSPQRDTYQVKLILDGQEHTVTVPPEMSVLDMAIQEGIDPPYACQLGICTTCRGKCTSGVVEMDETEGLSDQEIEEGYVLTCQSHPLTNDVVIEYG